MLYALPLPHCYRQRFTSVPYISAFLSALLQRDTLGGEQEQEPFTSECSDAAQRIAVSCAAGGRVKRYWPRARRAPANCEAAPDRSRVALK
jgi:hypothetical protein